MKEKRNRERTLSNAAVECDVYIVYRSSSLQKPESSARGLYSWYARPKSIDPIKFNVTLTIAFPAPVSFSRKLRIQRFIVKSITIGVHRLPGGRETGTKSGVQGRSPGTCVVLPKDDVILFRLIGETWRQIMTVIRSMTKTKRESSALLFPEHYRDIFYQLQRRVTASPR